MIWAEIVARLKMFCGHQTVICMFLIMLIKLTTISKPEMLIRAFRGDPWFPDSGHREMMDKYFPLSKQRMLPIQYLSTLACPWFRDTVPLLLWPVWVIITWEAFVKGLRSCVSTAWIEDLDNVPVTNTAAYCASYNKLPKLRFTAAPCCAWFCNITQWIFISSLWMNESEALLSLHQGSLRMSTSHHERGSASCLLNVVVVESSSSYSPDTNTQAGAVKCHFLTMWIW